MIEDFTKTKNKKETNYEKSIENLTININI